MKDHTVIYVIEDEGVQWQFFHCRADNDDHAQEQCENAYPNARVLWVNEGNSHLMECP